MGLEEAQEICLGGRVRVVDGNPSISRCLRLHVGQDESYGGCGQRDLYVELAPHEVVDLVSVGEDVGGDFHNLRFAIPKPISLSYSHWPISHNIPTVGHQSESFRVINGETKCGFELWLVEAGENQAKIGGVEATGEQVPAGGSKANHSVINGGPYRSPTPTDQFKGLFVGVAHLIKRLISAINGFCFWCRN